MIVITTPTGTIGHQLLPIVLDGPEPVRVIVRDRSRLPAAVRDRVEIVEGSHDDPDVVTEAFAGADTVFWVVPPNPHAESVEGHYEDFTRPACAAIASQGVKRVVAVSSLGRGRAERPGLLSGTFAMSALIEATGVDYRALAMPYFMENLLGQVAAIKSQGRFFMPNDPNAKLATVATRDVATAGAQLVLDASWKGQESLTVVGPDDLTPTEMAATLSDVLERPIAMHQTPGAAFKQTLLEHGVSDAWAEGLIDMAVAQDAGIYGAEARAAGRVGPTSFRQWCQETLKPAFSA